MLLVFEGDLVVRNAHQDAARMIRHVVGLSPVLGAFDSVGRGRGGDRRLSGDNWSGVNTVTFMLRVRLPVWKWKTCQ